MYERRYSGLPGGQGLPPNRTGPNPQKIAKLPRKVVGRARLEFCTFRGSFPPPRIVRQRSELLPFLHHNLVRVLVEYLAGTCRPKHAYWYSVLLQKVGYLPHSSDRLTRIVSEPTDRILRPVARRKWRAGKIGVEPRIGFLQAGNLVWIETTAITKKPRLRDESGEVPMVLPISSNDEPNKHGRLSLDQPPLPLHDPSLRQPLPKTRFFDPEHFCPALSFFS